MKKIGLKNYFDKKNILIKFLCEKNWVKRKVGVKKMFWVKKIFVKNTFWVKNILDQENFWSKKIGQKDVGSKLFSYKKKQVWLTQGGGYKFPPPSTLCC